MNKELKEQSREEFKLTMSIHSDERGRISERTLDNIADYWLSLIDKTVQMTEERIVGQVKTIIQNEKYEATQKELDEAPDEEKEAIASRLYINMKLNGVMKQIKSLITNKSDINKDKE